MDSRRDIEQESGGFRCVGACEVDKSARAIYARHWEEPAFSDVRLLDTRKLPDFDILCAGFPCQAFSVAGKRLGVEDSRGTLFYEIVRIARQKQPRLLFLENVAGLLYHEGGRTFATILLSLDELGYDVEWQVINSRHFVPQNRPRVFLVGHLRGKPSGQVFPLGTGDEGVAPRQAQPKATVANAFTAGGHSGGQHSGMTMIRWQNSDTGAILSDKAPALRASGGTDIRKKPMVIEAGLIQSRGLELRTDGFSPTVKGSGGGTAKPVVANAVTDGWLMDTAHHAHPMNQYRIRRLTPLECERLQGFPTDGRRG